MARQGKGLLSRQYSSRKAWLPELKRRAISQALEYNADTILIEDTGSGTSLIQDLGVDGTQGVPYPIGVTPEQDKITRMSSTSSKIEARQVHLPTNADWLDDFHTELMQFPNGRHDDQVDSLSQFLRWIEPRQGNEWSVEELLL
jgi:predicted phage terminase large subunit-like protein